VRVFHFVVLCFLFLIFFAGPAPSQDAPLARIEQVVVETAVGSTVFLTEIADTDELRSRGLMFRHRLPDDRAMLFDCKETRPVMMWMKNTHIALDMVFIRPGGLVAKVAENTVPMSKTIIDSGEPVAYVLEIAAGTARRIGLKPGDRVIHALIGNANG